MIEWIQKVREKPEGTRQTVAVACFVVLAGVVVTIWLWNLKGSFPYQSVTRAGEDASSAVTNGFQNFQEFRLKLGEIKQNMLNVFSSETAQSPEETQQGPTVIENGNGAEELQRMRENSN